MNQDFFWFCFFIASSHSLGWWWENSDPQKVLYDINSLTRRTHVSNAMFLCLVFTNFYFIYGLMIHKKRWKRVLIMSTIMTTTITPRSGESESLLITITTMRMNIIPITSRDKQFLVGYPLYCNTHMRSELDAILQVTP